jgi:hypothetical protein
VVNVSAVAFRPSDTRDVLVGNGGLKPRAKNHVHSVDEDPCNAVRTNAIPAPRHGVAEFFSGYHIVSESRG